MSYLSRVNEKNLKINKDIKGYIIKMTIQLTFISCCQNLVPTLPKMLPDNSMKVCLETDFVSLRFVKQVSPQTTKALSPLVLQTSGPSTGCQRSSNCRMIDKESRNSKTQSEDMP